MKNKHIKLIKIMLRLFNDWFQIVDRNKSKQRVVTFPDLLNKSIKIMKITIMLIIKM